MKKLKLILITLLISAGAFAQNVGINSDGSTPDASAMLDVKASNKGFLTPRMTATERGNISSPATGLLVYQTDSSAGYYFYNGSAWTQIGLASAATQWTASGSDIYYNSGNVGIGTTNPTSPLNIQLGLSSESTAAGIRLKGYSPAIELMDKDDQHNYYMGIDDNDGDKLVFGRGYGPGQEITPSITIDQSDNVGIGTTNPVHKLNVNGTGDANTGVLGVDVTGSAVDGFVWASSAIAPNLLTGKNVIHMIGKAENTNNSGYIGFNFIESGSSDNFLTFGLFGHDNLLNLTAAGNVGIGTTTPTRKMHISSASDAGLRIENTINSTAGDFYLYTSSLGGFNIWDNDAAADRLRIDGSGNIGIGTSSPAYTLHVNGSVAGVGAYVNASDARLKKEVISIKNGLEKVMQLRPITFNWKKDEYPDLNFDDRNHIGFIAQEVEEILPQIVSTADDEMQTKSIAYSDLVPVLTKAIQEQQAQIDELQKMVTELSKLLETAQNK